MNTRLNNPTSQRYRDNYHRIFGKTCDEVPDLPDSNHLAIYRFYITKQQLEKRFPNLFFDKLFEASITDAVIYSNFFMHWPLRPSESMTIEIDNNGMYAQFNSRCLKPKN